MVQALQAWVHSYCVDLALNYCPISFLCRFVQTCPVEFLKCSIADNLIKCAVAASTLSHREANASVMTFLRDLIHGPSELDPSLDSTMLKNLIGQVMTKHGQEITIGNPRFDRN